MKMKFTVLLILVLVMLGVTAYAADITSAFTDDDFRDFVLAKYCGGGSKINDTDVKDVKVLNIVMQRDIRSLDGIKHFTSLEILNITGTSIQTLDVSGLTALESLGCGSNSLLTSLDVSGCMVLEWLECGGNKLTTLNLSGCTKIEYIDVDNNDFTSLNLSGLTELKHIKCSYNKLTSLNLSGEATS